MVKALAKASKLLPALDGVATSLATQALIPGTTGRHQKKWFPFLSSRDGSERVWLEG
jgi:hypothetical protein